LKRGFLVGRRLDAARGGPLLRSRASVAVLLAAGVVGCHAGTREQPQPSGDEGGEPEVSVRTGLAKKGVLAETVEALGRCEALPDHVATLTPAVEGHVHELLVTQGDAVRKGAVIVELNKAVAQADLAEKSGTCDGLKATLVLLKSVPRPEERRANELAVEQAEVAVERAKAVLDRLGPLAARHEVSEQQMFDTEKAYQSARLQQQAAEATLRAMMIGPRPEAVAEAEAKIKTADGLVQFSRAHLDFHTIRAPIDGVLDSLTCHPGETIAVGSPIGTVVDTRHVFASIWLPPHVAASARIGMQAKVGHREAAELTPETSAPDEIEMEGKVTFVGRVADAQTGNLPIRVLVDNPQGRLTVGQSVRVSIVVAERKDVLQVPVEAVLDLGEGPVLNVVRDGKTVVLHPQMKVAHRGAVEIAGTDLKEGEPVILDGGYNLPEGTRVKPADANASAKEDEPAAEKSQTGSEAAK
jgi:RND family efflux transporter MFP subunit